jgi:hypothetical protein
MLEFLQNNQWIIGALVLGAIILTVMVMFLYPMVRGSFNQIAANTTFSTYERVTKLTPLGIGKDNTRLCDYYIASSAYSVFPGTTTQDYISDDVVVKVIKAGARLIELDIYAGDNDTPVVGLKNEQMGYNYALNSVDFESCCVAVANTAFNSVDTPLSSDPFIVSLVFHTDKRNVMDAAAEILKTTCQRFMLGPEYAYTRKNLAQEPMSTLMSKLILVSGGNIKGTNIEELVNLSWSTSNLRRLTYMQASQPYDQDELINSNRTNITMVVPDPEPDLKNNNPTILFTYGCQWNLMNYGSLDDMQAINIGTFQDGSIILKPVDLRYKPIEAKSPVLPDPATHSFQPMSQQSPIYDTDPKTGQKSITI